MIDASQAFAALSQTHRLRAFRLLVSAGEAGLTAGEIAAHLNAPASTTSTHLLRLVQARLLRHRREGRTIRYFAHKEGITDLLHFLLHDCCGNQPQLCAPFLSNLTPPETP